MICFDFRFCRSYTPAPTTQTTQSTSTSSTTTVATSTGSSTSNSSSSVSTTTTTSTFSSSNNVVYTPPISWWYYRINYPSRSYVPTSQCQTYYGTTALSSLITAYANPVSACPGSAVNVPVTVTNNSVHNLSLTVGGVAVSLSPYSSSTVNVPVTIPSGYNSSTYTTTVSISSLDCSPVTITAPVNVIQLSVSTVCSVSNASLTSASVTCNLNVGGSQCFSGATVSVVDQLGNTLTSFTVPSQTIAFTVNPSNYGCSSSNPSCTLNLSFVYNNVTVGSVTVPIQVTCANPTSISVNVPYIVLPPTTNSTTIGVTVGTQVPGSLTVMACTDSGCSNVLSSVTSSLSTTSYSTNLAVTIPPNISTIYVMAKDTCNNTAITQVPVYSLAGYLAVTGLTAYAPNIGINTQQVTVQVSGNLLAYSYWTSYSVPLSISIVSSGGTVVQKSITVTVPTTGQTGGGSVGGAPSALPMVITTGGGGGLPLTQVTIPFNAYLTFELPSSPGKYTYTVNASYGNTTLASTSFTINVVGGLFSITSYSCSQTYPCNTYPARQVAIGFTVQAIEGSGTANIYLFDNSGNVITSTSVNVSSSSPATSQLSFTAPTEPGTYTYYLVVRPSTAGGCPSNIANSTSGCYPVVINVVPLPVPALISVSPTTISAVSGNTYTVNVTYTCRQSACGSVQFSLVDTTSNVTLATSTSTCGCVMQSIVTSESGNYISRYTPCICNASLSFTATLPPNTQSYSTTLVLNATVAGITYNLTTIPMTVVPPCTPSVTFTPYITGNYDAGVGGSVNIIVTANNTAGCGANVTCSLVSSGGSTVSLCGGNPCTVSTHVPANSQTQLSMQAQFATSNLGSTYTLVCTYDTTSVNVATITLPSETIPVTIYCNGNPIYNNLRIGLPGPIRIMPLATTGLRAASASTQGVTASSYTSQLCTSSTYSGGALTYTIQITVASAPASWTANLQLSIPSLNLSTTTSASGSSGTSTQQATLSLTMANVPPGSYTGQISITLSYTYSGVTYSYSYTIPVTAVVYAPVTIGFINATYTAYAGQTITIPVGVCSQAPSNVIYKVVDNMGNAITRTVSITQSGCITDYVQYQVVGITNIDPQYILAYAEGLQDYLTQLQLGINVVDASLISSTAATLKGKVKR